MNLKKPNVPVGALLLTPVVSGIQNLSTITMAGGFLYPNSISKYVTPQFESKVQSY